MSSKVKVQECARRVKGMMSPADKLDALADAIAELAEFIEVVEHRMQHVEGRVRRMGL
ncbi:MAG: hypothetical protein ABSE22_02625 [Xanthobacteraceae bacterium]|jgi:CII-binding regulator of phage lambda lysogenization HflD